MSKGSDSVEVAESESTVERSGDFAATTKRSSGEMTEAHRLYLERWDPLVERLGVDHIWAASPRFAGRGEGKFYLAVKFGPRDYRVVAIDTSKPDSKPVVKVKSTASPSAILVEFKKFRAMAKVERDADREARKARAAKAKAKTRKPATRKAAS
jgi:hypothetical protein